jgi:hypothetical protein
MALAAYIRVQKVVPGTSLHHVYDVNSLHAPRKKLVKRLPTRHIHGQNSLYPQQQKLVQRLHLIHVRGLNSLYRHRKMLVQGLPQLHVHGVYPRRKNFVHRLPLRRIHGLKSFIPDEKSLSRDLLYCMYMAWTVYIRKEIGWPKNTTMACTWPEQPISATKKLVYWLPLLHVHGLISIYLQRKILTTDFLYGMYMVRTTNIR